MMVISFKGNSHLLNLYDDMDGERLFPYVIYELSYELYLF